MYFSLRQPLDGRFPNLMRGGGRGTSLFYPFAFLRSASAKTKKIESKSTMMPQAGYPHRVPGVGTRCATSKQPPRQSCQKGRLLHSSIARNCGPTVKIVWKH